MYQILIADDERKDRNIVKILLERRYAGQFRVWEAENGQQALEILRQEEIQLVLLDINMPGLSGIDVLHSLETRPYIIMLTAYDHFVYTREALRCGVRDYLLKPPMREEFYQAVGRFLQDQERSRSVFTRELAQQLMYYGDRGKMEALLDLTGIRGRLALCGLVDMELEDGEGLLDEIEGFLNRCRTGYAAARREGSRRLSGLIGAHGRERITDLAARYVRWLLGECRGTGRPQNNTVQLVLDRVREDCGRPWSIDSLADSLHVNAYYLSHLFKEHTGQCFTDYLAERRIERAVELMRTTDLSLAQIGERVGYADPNYFSRVFKKRRGVGPREFSRDWKTRTDLRD